MQIATYPAPACGGHSAAIREALLPRRASLFGFCCNHHFLLCFLKFTITTSCNLEQVKEERNVRICGLQKLSMVDYPGKLAATVFTGGCNLRCPFCHNALLVTRLAESPALTEQDVLDFLSTRRGLLDGVVLSGGEPLLHPGAADFLAAVQDMGFAVKLDTNGFYPQALKEILDRGLADYVAMDIKNCPARYGETCGVPGLDAGSVEESLSLLIGSGVDFELRTTLVRELHTAEDLAAMGRWVAGFFPEGRTPRFFLQKFVDSGNLIAGGCHGFSDDEMAALSEILRPFLPRAELRGVE